MYISVVLCIAHFSLSIFFVTLLQMLLPVTMLPLLASAVDTLPYVHVQCLQIFGQACPGIAAGHWLFSSMLGYHSQWPGDVAGSGLACSCMVWTAIWKQVEKHIAN